ncbi:Hcp family type VI secretion system effector [Paraferrimonas sedimenticola]|uniref:Protein hcp1 n=1 Tax=Paraferrimonas sedimenticola TaxID=375674 RepID=A0AA37RWZ4_9GAMM|nr:type VI secretion system tube protein Hcp [Paraferrimonas sedimenticola]GLP96844.1 protein hcp1 [Paraferrimonas sedimenticola]
MAMDMFFKIEGIEGESEDDTHGGEIDVLAWSWGCSQSGSTHIGGGSGSGKVNVQDISFTKWIDSASHNLLRHCCNGKHIASATLVCRKAGGDDPLEYITIEFEDLIVTSVSTGGSGGEDKLTENISLNFARFHFKYKPQTEDGGEEAEKEVKFDIKANKQ